MVKNTIWNLVGQISPMLVGIFAIPFLIKGLGSDRFGVLTLAWMVIGYFTFFDLGIGRALTKLVSEKLIYDERNEIAVLIWTASILMMVMGVIGGIILGMVSSSLVTSILNVPKYIQSDTLQTFYLLAISLPIVISTTGFRGILEAKQRFDLTNAVRIPMGVFTFLGPLFVLPFTTKLFWITLVLVVGRFISMFTYLIICLHMIPSMKYAIRFEYSMIKKLLAFGGWMTISNIISPLIVYFDRFLIGVLVSVTAVAYYSTPFEIVTKILIIPGAFGGVLFPVFSSTFMEDPQKSAKIYNSGLKFLLLILYPISLLIVTFAKEGLLFWIGSEFANNGFRVMQLLVIGVLFNGVAYIPFTFIQGVGRPDITAKLHLVEFIFYVPCVWWLITSYGIVGAGLAWVLRSSGDAICLLYYAGIIVKDCNVYKYIKIMVILILLLISLAISMISLPFVYKILLFSLMLSMFIVSVWNYIIEAEDKYYIFKLMETYTKSLLSG